MFTPNALYHREVQDTLVPNTLYSEILDNIVFSAVDLLLVNHEDKYVLWRRNNEPLKGVLWMPGGRMRKGEKKLGTLIRILKDEVWLDTSSIQQPLVQLNTYDFSYSNGPDKPNSFTDASSTVYVVKLQASAILDLSDQHGSYGLYSLGQIPDIHPDLDRVMSDHQYYLKHWKIPLEIDLNRLSQD